MGHLLGHTHPLGDPSEQDLRPFLHDDTAPTLMVPGHHSGLHDVNRRQGASGGDDYEQVPARPKHLNGPRWRVELHSENATMLPLRLEIADAAVLGRGHTADIPLDRYDNGTLGISRQHAMLRPSQRALFFFDLGSTNGTHHNGIPVGSGTAATLGLGDVIRLGRLTLTIRLLERVS
jgi:hypothetical protein